MQKNISIIKEKCVGCKSCEQVCPKQCISMQDNKEGFWYPNVVEAECIHCGLCLKACPTQNLSLHRNKPIEVWALRNKNEDQIMESASGGAADIATQVILEQNGIIYGAAYVEKLKVKHIEVSNDKTRKKLQSSKYVQSDLKDCYSKAKAHLEKGKKVLFTGTPCQIAGLYSFLGKDDPNLYTSDLICHGVPSPKFFEKYLEYQSKKMGEDIIYYNFRSKEKRGWGTQYLLKTKTKTKTQALSLDRFGKHFMDGDCYRESCYQCPYANIERVGDLTVGDFWGIFKSHPEFFSEKGVSSVFINTEKGMFLFERMKKYVEALEITLDEGMEKQGNLKRPTFRTQNRDQFYGSINNLNYIENMHIGIQLKNRLKAAIPASVIVKIKAH